MNTLASVFRVMSVATSLTVGLCMSAQARPEGIYASAQDWAAGVCATSFEPVVRKTRMMPEGYTRFRFQNEEGMHIGRGNWGLVYHDTLFVHYQRTWFVPALIQGSVCYFKGPPQVSEGQRMAINESYFWFGGFIGALTASDVYAQVKDRIHYVLDTRNGKLYPLGTGRMRILLAEHPAILAAFEQERQPPSLDVMWGYVRKLNAAEDGE